MNSKEQPIKKQNQSALEWFYDWMNYLVLYFMIFVLIMSFLFRATRVFGQSMEPTLHEGDRLILNSILYTPQRGDIVVISQPDGLTGEFDTNKVKRVIGVAGDEIDINYAEGRIYRNGKPLYEPYAKDIMRGPAGQHPMTFPLTVPDGHIFVVGDNRNNSLDSRDEQVGLVDERYVLGKAMFRFWPVGKFTFFENPEPVEQDGPYVTDSSSNS